MAVRPALPWHWQVAGVAAAAALVGIVVFLVLRTWSAGPADTEAELSALRARAGAQAVELGELRARAAQNERQLQIERAAAADLARQVKALTFDNAALKEDLAFFQSLMAAGKADDQPGLTINRFRLKPQAVAGEFRYQMLLVQSGPRLKEFDGRLEFVLDVLHEGRKLVLVLPAEGDTEAGDYRLSFKFFQRVEGTFKLAPGSVLKAMQVRVFENGVRAPRLTQSLNVS